MNQIHVTFTLNDKETNVSCDPNKTLLDVLRDDLGLTGAKDACGGEGECGACTVIFNGKPVNSCLIFIGQVMGQKITTIEGLSVKGVYHPVEICPLKGS